MGLFGFLKKKTVYEQNDSEIDSLLDEVDELLGEHLHKNERELPLIYDDAIDLIYKREQASASLLQAKLNISFKNACDILSEFEACGIVSEQAGHSPRTLLADSPKQAKIMLKKFQNRQNFVLMEQIDGMDGHAFEYWCAELLKKNGFTDVEVTKGSGDQGVDVIAVNKDGVRYAFQCKCYSSDLGNKPVQEVHAGKSMYHCQVGVVMTNRHFTSGAKELANATGVLLWDREKLKEMIEVSQ